jgi:hypothetical protein
MGRYSVTIQLAFLILFGLQGTNGKPKTHQRQLTKKHINQGKSLFISSNLKHNYGRLHLAAERFFIFRDPSFRSSPTY